MTDAYSVRQLLDNRIAQTPLARDASNRVATTQFIANAISNITAFGGVGDGATDNTTALNNAMKALSGTGGIIFFPAGKYKFSSAITFNYPTGLFSVGLRGAGQDATILFWPGNSGGITLNYSSALHSAHIRDMSLTTSGTGGTALNLVNSVSLGNFPGTDIENVVFTGDDRSLTAAWATAIVASAVSGVNIINCTLFGNNGSSIGISLAGGAGFQIVTNIQQCQFFSLGFGLAIGTQVQGVTVNQCNFTNGVTGIQINAGGSGLDQLCLTNSQFNVTGNAIIALSATPNVLVSNNLLIVSSGNSGVFLSLNNGFTIIGNKFDPVVAAQGLGVTLGTTSGGGIGTIVGNLFNDLSVGVDFLAGSTGVSVIGNQLTSVTTPIAFNGSGTYVVKDNVGYNPVGATAATNMGASPFTYTAGSSPETHYVKQTATNTATITQGGQQIAALVNASTYYTIHLGPNESYITTWATTTPTYTKFVH